MTGLAIVWVLFGFVIIAIGIATGRDLNVQAWSTIVIANIWFAAEAIK